MNYRSIYRSIISHAQSRNLATRYRAKKALGYVEYHHIIPSCMGGSDDKTNKVFLTAREHFVAHLLLMFMYRDNHHLKTSVERMLYDKQGNKLNGRTYGWVKTHLAEHKKTQNKHNNAAIAKQAATLTGRTKEEFEYLQAMSDKRKGLNKDNCEFIARGVEKVKGRTKDNHPGIAKMAAIKSGQTAATHPHVAQIAEARCKLNPEQRKLLVKMKEVDKMQLKDIWRYFVGLGIDICYSAIHQMYHREKVK